MAETCAGEGLGAHGEGEDGARHQSRSRAPPQAGGSQQGHGAPLRHTSPRYLSHKMLGDRIHWAGGSPQGPWLSTAKRSQ